MLVLLLLPVYGLRRLRTRPAGLAGLLLAAALLLPGLPAGAVDTDEDGFTDLQEEAGIVLQDGTTIPFCGSDSTLERHECMDPNNKDLFVIILRADPGCDPLVDSRCIPPSPEVTLLISRPMVDEGLDIAVHEIPPHPTIAGDRTVSSAVGVTQKAIQIAESRNVLGDKMGNCPGQHGTPNDDAVCTVFTQKIFDFVTEKCATATSCKLSTGSASGSTVAQQVDEVVRRYVLHTTNHEIAHYLQLRMNFDRRFGFHLKTGAFKVLEASTKFTKKGSKVTWYVGTDFSLPSQEDATLVGTP